MNNKSTNDTSENSAFSVHSETGRMTTTGSHHHHHHHHHHSRSSEDSSHEPQPCYLRHLRYLKQHPTILLASLCIFTALTAVGITISVLSYKSKTNHNYNQAMSMAAEASKALSLTVESSFVPLFAMAQFAVQLPVFEELAGIIGAAHEAGSLSFARQEDGTFHPFRRNVTGVCDDPNLIERYASLGTSVIANLNMQDIVGDLQFSPAGVVCLTTGKNDLTPVVGVDLLNVPGYTDAFYDSFVQDRLHVDGPIELRTSCPQCVGLHFHCRLPVHSNRGDVIQLQGKLLENRWGYVDSHVSWNEIMERSQLHQLMRGFDLKFQLRQFQLQWDKEVGNHVMKESVLTGSDDYDESKPDNVETVIDLHVHNMDWKLRIQYDDDDDNQALLFAVSILLSIFITLLIHIVMVQKQVQAKILGQAMAEKAKAIVEKRMTSYIAHELRNPHSSLDSALAAMPDDLSPDVQELVLGMKICSSFMSNIMDNLLDVRKLEEGKLILRSDPMSLTELVDEVRRMNVASVRPGVELNVVVDTANGGGDWVYGDIHRMQQVLANITTNAIKYTMSGSITLVATWEGDMVRLECRDTGPGIPKEEQKMLFERFVKRGGAKGSGLGLAIAKKIVNLMEGTIHFESDPTIKPGTSCIVLVPLPPCRQDEVLLLEDGDDDTQGEHQPDDNPAAVHHAVADSSSDSNSPIEEVFSLLIVDDIPMSRTMLKKRISKLIAKNCLISEAATGEEALELCEQRQTSFDIVIMDQYMEQAGGIMVGTDVIAAMRREKMDSYIIGCSGNNDLDQTFWSAGCDLVWGKPMPSNAEMQRQFRHALECRAVS